MAKRKPPKGPKGKIVRRTDKNDRPYFIERATGKRVPKDTWQEDRARIKRNREAQERRREAARQAEVAKVAEEARKARRKRQKGPPERGPAGPGPGPVAPFPPGVDEPGIPIDEDGDYDDNSFAVEGEDETP